MRYVAKNRKRLLVLCVGIFLICGIALGYAVLSQSIKINGTGTISTNWDILFTNITEKGSKGATSNDSRITDKLTATFDVDLESPGSYIEYNIKIRNNGNTDAVIAKVAGIVEANSASPTEIQFKLSGIRIGDDLLAGSEKTFVVRAEMPRSVTALPQKSKTLDLKVDVRQKEVDSSGLVTTLNECFVMNNAGDTITGYLCGKGNTNGYSEIVDVNIPGSINGVPITKIGAKAFDNKGLTAVNIPNTVTTIESQAFSTNQLKQLRLPNSVKTIGNHAFVSNKLTEIEIPSSVISLGSSVFRLNEMPPEKAFIYNRNSDGTENKTILNSYAGSQWKNVVVPDHVRVIGAHAFQATNITAIELPEQLTTISTGAFMSNMDSLKSIVLPASLTTLNVDAFAGCRALSNVEFKGNVPNVLGTGIFTNTALLKANTIKVPVGTLDQYKTARAGSYSTGKTWFGKDDASLDAFYE